MKAYLSCSSFFLILLILGTAAGKDKLESATPDAWLPVACQTISLNGLDLNLSEQIGRELGPRAQEVYVRNAADKQRMQGTYLNLIGVDIDGEKYFLKETSDSPIMLPGADKTGRTVELSGVKLGVFYRKGRYITLDTQMKKHYFLAIKISAARLPAAQCNLSIMARSNAYTKSSSGCDNECTDSGLQPSRSGL